MDRREASGWAELGTGGVAAGTGVGVALGDKNGRINRRLDSAYRKRTRVKMRAATGTLGGLAADDTPIRPASVSGKRGRQILDASGKRTGHRYPSPRKEAAARFKAARGPWEQKLVRGMPKKWVARGALGAPLVVGGGILMNRGSNNLEAVGKASAGEIAGKVVRTGREGVNAFKQGYKQAGGPALNGKTLSRMKRDAKTSFTSSYRLSRMGATPRQAREYARSQVQFNRDLDKFVDRPIRVRGPFEKAVQPDINAPRNTVAYGTADFLRRKAAYRKAHRSTVAAADGGRKGVVLARGLLMAKAYEPLVMPRELQYGIPRNRVDPISPLAVLTSSSMMADLMLGAAGKNLSRKQRKQIRRGAYDFAGASRFMYTPAGQMRRVAW